MVNVNYDDLIKDTLHDNKLVKVNENIYLTEYQMEVLKKYQIPFESCNSIHEIVFLLEDILNEDSSDLEDLEQVSASLAEVDYYAYYRK